MEKEGKINVGKEKSQKLCLIRSGTCDYEVGGKGRVGDAHVRESGAGLFLSDGDRWVSVGPTLPRWSTYSATCCPLFAGPTLPPLLAIPRVTSIHDVDPPFLLLNWRCINLFRNNMSYRNTLSHTFIHKFLIHLNLFVANAKQVYVILFYFLWTIYIYIHMKMFYKKACTWHSQKKLIWN